MNSKEIEVKLIQQFVKKNKQARYLNFISIPKLRQKFLKELPHFKDFNMVKFEKIKKNEKSIIMERLKSIGPLQDCYIISDNSHLDEKRIGIEEALNTSIGYGSGTIIVFGKTELIYYDGEDDRLLSKTD